MQFLLVAHDGTDDGALGRRLASRAEHLALGDAMVAEGTMLYGTAILDDAGRMVGSMIVLELPDRAAVEAWLAREPYVRGGVWERITISACRVGPSFERRHR